MGVPVYPTNVKTFTTKQDGIDTVVASHVNALQDEVVGLQNHVGIVSELPDLSLPSGATVTKRVGPQVNGLKQWADHLSASKAPLNTPTFTGTVTLPETTSIGSITKEEILTLHGITIGTTIQGQLNAKANLNGAEFTGAVRASHADGVITDLIQNRNWGNLNLHANGGAVVAKNLNNTLVNVRCATPIIADDAVTKGHLDLNMQVVNQAFARKPNSFWNPTWGANEMAVTCAFANQHISLAAWGASLYNVPYLGFALNGQSSGPGNNGYWILTNAVPGSSLTIKDDIRDITEEEQSAFDMIEPKAFRYKDTGEFHFGFIAENVKAAGVPVPMVPHGPVPTTPGEEINLVPGLYERDLISILWAQVKKQQQQIEVLTQQVNNA